ncbi:envelope glycoprotein [Lonchura striata]|uniref:Envelope glycoprotein n=1 Tax=Lonchura striata TaxID=40157 RepID=A0A218VCU5_9PASE|nr:envelope glycoprotein [Lonchura striata domestica]
MQATFGVLNHTHPNLTKGCWLCYMINPHFYEAIGITSEAREINGTNPKECLWKKEGDNVSGITLSQVSGQGRCVGKVPADMRHLCNTTMNISRTDKPSDWLMPAVNTKWVCQQLGVTPCLSVRAFDNSDFCIQVLIIPRIVYHPKEYVLEHQRTPEHYLVKREPLTALTVAILLSIGGAGVGTGVASLVSQTQGMKALRTSVDEDLSRIDKDISELVKSIKSLSEVVLQNRRGLDLLFLQQGGLCVALQEECCAYVDHTGIVKDTMAELRKQIEQ